tara:strand:- start:41 stop:958 length:918 start_codon:yes stop_codon:yes gene_type:complete
MAELKNTFTGGKMEKDLDERIVPTSQYREALNISVATSEDSDVGAAQNILGNVKVTEAIQSRTMAMGKEYAGDNYHVAEVIDPQTSMLYRFIHTASTSQGIWMDRIVEFDTQSSLDIPWDQKENAVMVDIFKVESRIDDHSIFCSNNKSYITISANINQIRWGMKVEGVGALIAPVGVDVTIEDVNYSTGNITLNQPLTIASGAVSFPIVILGDRNLSFGDTNNIKNITGINIIDGMIFWTDNFSEPKKVNIERSKDGCDSVNAVGYVPGRGIDKIDDFNQHTLLIVNDTNPQNCTIDDQFGCTP